MKKIMRVAVTGGAGQIAYSLLFRIAAGEIFGSNQKIALHIYDLPAMESVLQGVAMELADCAFELLHEIKVTSDLEEAFGGIDLALLVGAKPRSKGMERGDLLLGNGEIFVKAGKALNAVASQDAKIVVVGNPCNTNCLIAMHHAPNLPRKNFHSMMRLDQNRATALLATKAGCEVAKVQHVSIWGNHSATQVPDYTHALIDQKPASEVIGDTQWLQGDFFECVQKRGAAIIAARGKSSAASAASALIDAVRSLYQPTPAGHWHTSAVCTDGNPYGIEENLIFGFPLITKSDSEYQIVSDCKWDFFIKEKIAVTQKELIAERDCVKHLL